MFYQAIHKKLSNFPKLVWVSQSCVYEILCFQDIAPWIHQQQVQSFLKFGNHVELPVGFERHNADERSDILREKITWWGIDSHWYRYEEVSNSTPGRYFPRIFAPTVKQRNGHCYFSSKIERLLTGEKHDYFPINLDDLVSSLQQLETIVSRLKSIFLYILPTKENFGAFGHEIRNLLILTSTEVETQMKGILIANSYVEKGRRLNTKDYVLLNNRLRLEKYAIRFPHFPKIQYLYPFKGWDATNPTKSLFWYDSYNLVKHDRESKFHFATIESVINAVAALCVMFIAQYGCDIPYWSELIGNFFEVGDSPVWRLSDCYFPPFEDQAYKAEQFVFY